MNRVNTDGKIQAVHNQQISVTSLGTYPVFRDN